MIDLPFPTRAQEFRRDWRTVIAAAVGVGAGVTGLPFYTLGLLVRPLSVEFGWSRAAVSGAALCLQGGIVLSAPLVGRLIDHSGLRRVALLSLLGLAAAFALLPLLSSSILLFYAAWLALSLVGGGSTPVVWTRAVAARFSAGRGLALGMTLLGTGIAGIVAPALFGPIIARHGWRAGCLAVAATIVVIAMPVVFAMLREVRPIEATNQAGAETGMALGEAIRTRRFAQLGLAFLLLGGTIAGLIVHLVPILTDRGMDALAAARAAALLGFAVIAGRLVVGWLVDRFHAPYVGMTFLLLPVASCLVLLNHGAAGLAIVLLGLAAGAEIDLLAYFVSRYFGMRAYGEIYGWLLSIFSLGAGIGPVLAGASFDRTGSYDVMLTGACGAIAIGALLVGTLGRFPAGQPR